MITAFCLLGCFIAALVIHHREVTRAKALGVTSIRFYPKLPFVLAVLLFVLFMMRVYSVYVVMNAGGSAW